jgi:membrane-bound lytic murein transglycosylase A
MRHAAGLAGAGRVVSCVAAALVACVSACAPRPPAGPVFPAPESHIAVPPGTGPAFTPVRFDQLPGWAQEHPAQAIPAFLAGCIAMPNKPDLGGQGETALRGGTAQRWQTACAAARAVTPGDDIGARAYFEANFQPWIVSNDGSAAGLFTGYYEPEVRGSRVRDAAHREPLYRRPPNLVSGPGARPYLSRAEIDRGLLANRRLELVWLTDPIDNFFLHIQGSGRVLLDNGETMRVAYDGQNGHGYVPVGRVLVDRGEMTLDQVSMQSIRLWLNTHPAASREVMQRNPSFVFFKELPDPGADVGAPGALGAPLLPMRSVAVDRGFIPLGAPMFIDTRDPVDGSKIQRLMMAHDLGGAIRGAVRADLFFGWGPEAEEKAGRMRQQGAAFVLLPKG